MARNRILYGLAVLACLIFSVCYVSTLSAVLLAAVAAYPLLAVIFTVIQMCCVKAEFSEKRIVAEKDTPFEISLDVRNGSVFPCVPLEMVCSLPDREQGVFSDKNIFASLSPLCKAKLQFPCRHIYRGCYSCEIKKISVVDPLRIIRLTKKTDVKATMVFLPRKMNLYELKKSAMGTSSSSSVSRLSAEKEDFSHVRDYRDGDNIQLVHWKLTAKQDEFMIKEFDSPDERHAVVLPDFGGNSGDRMLYIDTVIETAVAFVKVFMEHDISVSADIGQLSRRKVMHISNKAEFRQYFEFMSVVPADTEVCDFPSLVDGFIDDGELFMVLITDNLSDEVILRAKAAAERMKVFLAYVNLSGKPVADVFSKERFYFLNIRGAGEEALNSAVAEAMNTYG